VPDGVTVDASELTRVAGAISKQVERDFAPPWEVQATVDAYAKLDDVPIDYWHVVLMETVEGAAGYHEDDNGQPYAVVQFDEQWSLTASHECLEMLADPFGRRLRAGPLLDQAVKLGLPQRRVNYLVEVCDPSEAAQFAYQSNGVLVSDFYTPNFFDPVTSGGVKYSFSGAITAPRTVLDGGYISWHDPVSDDWMQLRMFKDDISSKVPHVVNLSKDTNFDELRKTMPLRAAVDRVTQKGPDVQRRPRGKVLTAARHGSELSEKARAAKAQRFRRQVAAMARRVR